MCISDIFKLEMGWIMVIITKIKQKLGQDLNYVRNEIAVLNSSLNQELRNMPVNESRVTYLRGRMIRFMRQEIDLIQDPVLKVQKEQTLYSELNKHKSQLTTRIDLNKKSPNNKITTELGLKIKRTIASYKQVPLSSGAGDIATNIAIGAGETLSTLGTVVKIPLVASARVLKVGARLTARIVTLPLHIVPFIFSKIVNPDAPYNGMLVGKVSEGLEEILKASMDKTEEVVRRI